MNHLIYVYALSLSLSLSHTHTHTHLRGLFLFFTFHHYIGDYNQEMNSVVFLEWFENQLMTPLKNPSLVVLDNASYHNVKTEDNVSSRYTISYPACFPKRFDLSQIITPIIDNRHLVVQNSSIITYSCRV
jgi:hypothetical protein